MNKEQMIVKCVAQILDQLLVITKDENKIIDAWPAITLAVRELSGALTGDAGDHIVINEAVKHILKTWAD